MKSCTVDLLLSPARARVRIPTMAAALESPSAPHFDATLARHGIPALTRKSPTTIQVNVGKLCNQACHHCHVDAGPRRTEVMTRSTARRGIQVLAASRRV